VKRLADREAAYIPNAAPVAAIRATPGASVATIREKYELEGKFTIGFIANHTMPFDGMERLVRGFVIARQTRPALRLLIVGPGGERALKYGADNGVIVAGAVPPEEVGAWFLACDAGAHPQDLSPVTHDAMALNVLEFSASGKPVLSNPLREFQRLALPNIRFTRDDSVQAWAEALSEPASFAPFDAAVLHATIQDFDWDTRSLPPYQAKWQATCRAGPALRKTGISAEQRGSPCGQRP
jgi:glycosyltransferase involved in cell wall biosynthesis